MFSKLFDDAINQFDHFAAVMTCDHADENCPFIPGTEQRISVQYADPKAFDGTSEEAARYDERSFQIASEMFYVFSKIQ
jgi:arsenate reductase